MSSRGATIRSPLSRSWAEFPRRRDSDAMVVVLSSGTRDVPRTLGLPGGSPQGGGLPGMRKHLVWILAAIMAISVAGYAWARADTSTSNATIAVTPEKLSK